jgi:hypothetical protein
MAKLNPDETMVDARIVYWGTQGAGKTTNLQSIHRKLRPDLRGEIEREATRIDPAVEFEQLPIELGEIGGLRTRIQMIAVPGGAGQAPTRKQLLDQVDGIVLVVDSRPACLDANVASLDELRTVLDEYGHALEDVPLVIQYNKRDLTDPYSLEELHRRLDVRGAAVFESVATEATGVLQTLSTLAKHVIRRLRSQQFASPTKAPQEPMVEAAEAPLAPEPMVEAEPFDPIEVTEEFKSFDPAMGTDELQTHHIESPPEQATVLAAEPATREIQDLDSDSFPTASERIEDAILSESEHPEMIAIDDLARKAQTVFESPLDESLADPDQPAPGLIDTEFSIASVGEATRVGDRGLRIPLEIAGKDQRRSTLVLTIQLDPLLVEDPD